MPADARRCPQARPDRISASLSNDENHLRFRQAVVAVSWLGLNWVQLLMSSHCTWNRNADIMSHAYTAYTRKPPQTPKAPVKRFNPS